ncbi:MAG: ABC transporter permease [Solirubrobacterales bacterium]|nr:ABC transporter permease [Solirubrobacterales bacterium]
MSTPAPPAEAPGSTTAGRLSGFLRSGGVITPVLTALLAFLIGGLVVALTGKNPLTTYQAFYEGTGLSWLLPWTGEREFAAANLQSTLILTTPLILVGFAVAYAFRAGLFNIGGQGQYSVGAIVAVYVGSSLPDLPGVLHILLALLLGALAGGLWAGIAGLLRATVGANEVISTIMLNYIALWIGVYLFGLMGPLQNDTDPSLPISNDIVMDARLPVFWGDAELQGLHVGLFVALAVGIVFWVLLNRSVKGYEARAVGFSPDAAAYGGINVGRTYVTVMVTCGLFAGLAGAIDVLGWQFRVATNDIQGSQIGFLGIAVALLGRNTAVGTMLSALLFGALLQGTNVRNLDPAVFDPALAGNLTTIIQGLVVLFVSADVLVVYLYRLRRRRNREEEAAPPGVAEAAS